MKLNKFNKLPFINANFLIEEKFKEKKIIKGLIDIFDFDLWSSKLSIVVNGFLFFIILISTFEVIFSSSDFSIKHEYFFKLLDYSTSIIFSIEIISRLLLSPYFAKEYSGKYGRIKYFFSFYNIIDFLSIIPFWSFFLGLKISSSLKIFRVLRIWRIIRFIPSFGFITTALHKKKDEINATLLGVIFLSVTISAMIYHVEKDAGTNSFKSIIQVLIWSIGKYTGDYGGIAEYIPITLFGKFLATINGLLGIALFALPAGLIGSAFIDEIGENKKRKELEKIVNDINSLFAKSYLPNKTLNNKSVYYRHFKFYSIQAELLISEEEMLKCVRFHKNFRCRIKKEVNSIYLERFNLNTGYGFKKINPNSRFFIINPLGETQNGISHFTSSISDILGLNLISVENKIEDAVSDNFKNINFNETTYFTKYRESPDEVPIEFREFMADIKAINDDNVVLIIQPCKSDYEDFYINEINSNKSENKDFFYTAFKKQASYVKFEGEDKSFVELKNMNVEKKENTAKLSLAPTIHYYTKTNVITLHVNEKYLNTNDHDLYYAIMQEIITIIHELYPKHIETS